MSIETEHTEHDKQAKQVIKDNIDKFGCHLALLESDNYLPAFTYSIGIYETFKHPEIVCFGLSTDLMGRIINHAVSRIKDGDFFQVGKLYSGFLEGYDIQFVEVNNVYYPHYFGYGGWYYNSFKFPVLQIIWPDKEQLFPWEDGFNSNWKFKQPLLDRNEDFIFYEERSLGVYTTKQVLSGEPILHVYHDEEGDWQFFSDDAPKEDDAALVCLEEIVKLDPSINDLYHLQYGWKAWRNSIDNEWEYDEDVKN